jgi:putative peptide zinc metalloprotease protein
MQLRHLTTRLLKRAGRLANDWADDRLASDGPRPAHAPGVEFLGEYQDSGFKDPPYLVKAPDGKIVQVPRLLYLVGEAADGERTTQQIADSLSDTVSRHLRPQDIEFLIVTKLQPLGLMAGQDGSATPAPAADPFLALRFRAAVVPASLVRGVAWLLRPLFWPIVVGAALAWLVTFDVWLFAHHGIGAALQQVAAQPLLVLAMLGMVLVATAWHEIGHATACRYGGATPGRVGVGIYVIWPAFYTDVTDAYRLDRAGRLRTDLGGVYFNVLFMLGTAAAYFATGFEPLLALIALQHVQTIQQFMPFVRLDGYYVLTDLVGVPDVLSRIRPILTSLVPGRPLDPRVAGLKPWVRFVVTVYVLFLVVVLSGITALMLAHAPRYFAMASTLFPVQLANATTAFHAHQWIPATVAGLRILMLLLPAIGMGLLTVRILKFVMRPIVKRLPGGGVRERFALRARMAVAFAAGGALAFALASGSLSGALAGDHSAGKAADSARSHRDIAMAKKRHRATLKRRHRAIAKRRARKRAAAAAQSQSQTPTPTPTQSQTPTAPAPAPQPSPAPSQAPAPAPSSPPATSGNGSGTSSQQGPQTSTTDSGSTTSGSATQP